MSRGSAGCASFGLLVGLALSALLAGGCGDDGEPTTDPADPADAPHGDVTDEPDTGGVFLDANLPQADVRIVVDDADATGDDDADAYTLPANSVTTCTGFFECMQNCPPGVDSCAGACHDAMDEETASLVTRLMGCLNSHGCRDGDCAMRNCGSEASACFNDD